MELSHSNDLYKLCMKMLLKAIFDLFVEGPVQKHRDRCCNRKPDVCVLRWINGGAAVLSFEDVCNHLGLIPHKVRSIIFDLVSEVKEILLVQGEKKYPKGVVVELLAKKIMSSDMYNEMTIAEISEVSGLTRYALLKANKQVNKIIPTVRDRAMGSSFRQLVSKKFHEAYPGKLKRWDSKQFFVRRQPL
jgi:hypothetical protein